MATIKYVESNGTEHVIEIESGKTLMQGAVDNLIDGIIAECGGSCCCATCHCIVDDDWYSIVGEATSEEEDMLAAVPQQFPTSRLSCQITVTDEMDGLTVHLPEAQY